MFDNIISSGKEIRQKLNFVWISGKGENSCSIGRHNCLNGKISSYKIYYLQLQQETLHKNKEDKWSSKDKLNEVYSIKFAYNYIKKLKRLTLSNIYNKIICN